MGEKDTKEETEQSSEKTEQKPAKKPVKVKRALFVTTFYEGGKPKYEAGKHYPLTDETRSQIVAGAAGETTVELDPEAHEVECKAANESLNALWAHTRKAEAAARISGELK